MAEFVTAMHYGTSPEGRHYYPAFPYTSYTRMTVSSRSGASRWSSSSSRIAWEPTRRAMRATVEG